jgi:hypothetical protein
MKPNTNKPKTGRRFRGLEVAQAALLLVLGVVVAMALYFLMVEIIQSTPVPIAQLDPYSSYFYTLNNENYAFVYLKFAKSVTVKLVDIIDGNNWNFLTPPCQWWNVDHWENFPLPAYAGKEYQFQCKLNPGKTWQPKMYVHLVLSDGTVYYIPWITG